MEIYPRYYQLDGLTAIKTAYDARDVDSGIVVWATGGGKSLIFSNLPETLNIHRMLILAHREELVYQAYEHMKRNNPNLRIGIEKAEYYADDKDTIVIGSVQTLCSRKKNDKDEFELNERLLRFGPKSFDVVIIDECHHATANGYLRILQHLKAGTPEGPFLLGITATAMRGDETPLANVFERVIHEKGIRELIQEGWLCDLRPVRIKTKTDISDLSVRMGDFAENELAQRVNTDERNSFIISGIQNHAQDRKCILVFAVDIDHIESLTLQLNKAGIETAGIHYKMPKQDRVKILDAYRNGDLRCIVNCQILTEGFDNPRIDCLAMARPTQSPLLFAQMIGRGTRMPCPKCWSSNIDVSKHKIFKGELVWRCKSCNHVWLKDESKDCKVLDYVDICGRHRIMTAAEMFGFRDVNMLATPILEAEQVMRRADQLGLNVADGDDIEDVARRNNLVDQLARGIKKLRTEAEAIDLFQAAAQAEDILEFSKFPWMQVGRDRYLLISQMKKRIGFWKDALGIWRCCAGHDVMVLDKNPRNIPWKFADKCVKLFLNERIPVGKGEFTVPQWKFILSDANWTKKKPTVGQIEMLKKLGVYVIDKNMNRGAAARAITRIQMARGR